MSGETHEISLLIGRLQASVDNLCGDVADLRGENRQHMAEAREFRQAMAGTVAQVAATKDDVAAMKLHVDDYKRTKQRMIGAVIGGSAGAGGFAGWLAKLLG